MAKRKVLIVVNHLTVGGVQKSLISALNSIDYEENEVTVYLRKNRTMLLPFVNENVNIVINDDKTHYYRSLKSLFYLFTIKIFQLFGKDTGKPEARLQSYVTDRRMNHEKKVHFNDIIYDLAISYVQGYPAYFVSKYVDAKRKIVFYQGSTDELHEVHENAFPLFDLIVVEHMDIARSLCSWYDGLGQKIRILDNYTDHNLIRRLASETNESIEHNCPVICTCARFEYVKGIDLAVEAARLLRDKGIEFAWYIVGDGTERVKIESLIEQYHLQKNVILTGMKTNPYPYMGAADIYVQPSREEALSIAMLESQILCVPMVSTNTAGGFAMVNEGVDGLLSEFDPESLAQKIERLINDSELRANMKAALSEFDYSPKETEYKENWAKLLRG